VPLAAKEVGEGEVEGDPELEHPKIARPEMVSRTRALNAASLRERMPSNPTKSRPANAMPAEARFGVAGGAGENGQRLNRDVSCGRFCREATVIAVLDLGWPPGAVTAPAAAQAVELV